MLLRRIARPMMSTWFVSEGLDAVRSPAAHVAFMRPAVDALVSRLDAVQRPTDARLRIFVQAHGAVTALAGLALAFGKAPRTAALLLAALTLPLAAGSIPLVKGEKPSPEVRRERRDRLVRSLAFTGAALIAGVDLEGRPGATWRLAKAREVASSRTSDAIHHAKAAVTPQ